MPLPFFSTRQDAGTDERERCCNWLKPALVVWIALVAWGWWSVAAYDFKQESVGLPGAVADWPPDTQINLEPGRETILFFLHPRCPCTAASLAEMERLLVPPKGDPHALPQVVVVATVPDTRSHEWRSTRTIEHARRLPSATLHVDLNGREAARFGASSSGTVMWFDARRRRLYAGGITMARGHEGDNVGRDRLAALLHGSRHSEEGIPAFGCTLCLPNE